MESLPSKENSLFRDILKLYEMKQYKKALKAADQILKKFPQHGQTISMRGLVLNAMGKKEEAYDHAKKGLMFGITSHVCWHVFGLLHRSDRNYPEAIKCYINALKHDPDNLQILKDMSLLQVQVRDFKGFMETRNKLLVLKPNQKVHWLGFVASLHLNKKYSVALEAIDSYFTSVSEEDDEMEKSELLLYKNQILMESGDYEKALENLLKIEKDVIDEIIWLERKGELLLKLNRQEEATAVYWNLLDLNSENFEYHSKLRECMDLSYETGDILSEELQDKLLHLYVQLKEKYPKSNAATRIPLDFTFGGRFKEQLCTFVVPYLRKGIPSLFSALKGLYSNVEKCRTIEECFLAFLDSLRTTKTFPEDLVKSDTKELPSVELWVLMFLALHYDHIHYNEKALDYINAAIDHTPTIPELYIAKGRIAKNMGAVDMAAAAGDEGRKLDLADRYLNKKCVKYFCRADNIDAAEQTAQLFMRADQMSPFDTQWVWYELEFADSYWRQGDVGNALQKYVCVDKHYTDYKEDQFDFHVYCMRRGNLRTYVDMIRNDVKLMSRPNNQRALRGLIKCYMYLHRNPTYGKENSTEDEKYKGLSAAEIKKKKRLDRKKKAKEKKSEKDKEESASKEAKKDPDEDEVTKEPKLKDLLQVENPLEEAMKYAKLLLEYAPDNIDNILAMLDVFKETKKPLLVLKCLIRGKRTSPNDSRLHESTVEFFLSEKVEAVGTEGDEMEVIEQVIKMEKEKLLEGKTVTEYCKDWMQKWVGRQRDEYGESYFSKAFHASLVYRKYVSKDSDAAWDVVKQMKSYSPSYKDCYRGLEVVRVHFPHRVEEYKELCRVLYPLSVDFKDKAVSDNQKEKTKSEE